VKRRASTGVRNGMGYDALMIAAREGRADIMRALLQARADRTLRNRKRETARDIAVASGHADIAQLLK
jgi:ankyrin repeat protein